MGRSAVIHACLIEIAGIGVVITGESGVGKTSVCLELENLGHRFVADDAVEIWLSGNDVVGGPPKQTAGIVSIRDFGLVRRSSLSDTITQFAAIPIGSVIELHAIGSDSSDDSISGLLDSVPFSRFDNCDVVKTARSIETHVKALIQNGRNLSYG